MCREMSAGYQNGLNYIALNLMEGNLGGCRLGDCDGLLRFKTACGCKGGMNGFNTSPYVSLGFKETAAAVKGLSAALHMTHGGVQGHADIVLESLISD
ncbi:hypothetical protein D9C73_001672 [Collichthys lucidus]|uniref:Uncharacterized protein n=1 Tax=Collichthys lucidus TaxID=240159 RepID=A0A4U5U2D4_COLLU|nr:hypothetical protein D9C73_001672 [Collichthys lucidus]